MKRIEFFARTLAFIGFAASVGFYGVSYAISLFNDPASIEAFYENPIYSISPGGLSLGRWAVFITVAAGSFSIHRTLLGFIKRFAIWVRDIALDRRGARRNLGEVLRRLGPRKVVAIGFLWTVAPAVVGYLAFEAYVRVDFLIGYKATDHVLVFKNRTLDQSNFDELLETGEKTHPLGLFKANQSFTTTFFVPREGDKIGFQVTVRTNNLGYLSERPYRIERTSDEYRVVVIGDSFTGETTASSPWVDRLEDILNADALLRKEIGDRAIRVFNLGWPGAGFPHFQTVMDEKALQFDPDLVVVNYIEADFPRRRGGGDDIPGNTIRSGLATMSVNDTPQTRFYIKLLCSEPPVTLRNPMCYQSFNIFVGDDFPLRPEMLMKVYDLITEEYLVGKAVFTLFPYGYHKIIGNIKGYDQFRQPNIFRFSPISHSEMINGAVKILRTIKKKHPNVLFTLHPIFEDIFDGKKGTRLTDEMLEIAPDLEVVKMRDRLPIKGLSKDDIKQWYNLPYDGHMSDKGGRVYAKVFAELLASHIRKTALSSAKNSNLQPNPGEASK